MPEDTFSSEEGANDESAGEESESFADLLASYDTGAGIDIQIGDRVEGTVIAIGRDTVFIDVGTKVDAAVDKVELADDNDELDCQIGDRLTLYVVALSEGEIRLSKALSGIGGMALLQEAHDQSLPVEGRVIEPCKGGLHVEILKRRAFCPISQIDVAYVEDTAAYVGQTYPFLITRLEERAKNIVVSRRRLLEQEQQKQIEAFLADLSVGAVVEATVKRIVPFGVFAELVPGLEGMIHISELGWSRYDSPDEAVQEGQRVGVKVVKIEPVAGKRGPKIGLSIKQLEADPWESAADRLKPGDRIKGQVRRLMPFGAFVEILPGIEGLVHISEISYTQRIAHPQDVLSPGEEIYVMVKQLDLGQRRIGLSLKDAIGDPWADVGTKYSQGQEIEGHMARKENFGLFIELEPGITGLLPRSKMAEHPDAAALERLKPGDAVTVRIDTIRPQERKMSLAPGGGETGGDWQAFSSETSAPMSDLAEKLQRALKPKAE